MPQNPRQTILRLLRQGTEAKLAAHDSQAASSKLEEAYRLSQESGSVGPPLRSEIAYRLAIVRLRTATTAEDLERCADLFLEDVRSSAVGLWPRVYRVAALTRLLAMVEGQQRKSVRNRLERTWEHLIASPNLTEAEETASQHLVVNTLEALAIAGGLDGTSLVGRRANWPQAYMVDENPNTADLNLSWEIARAEAAAQSDMRGCWAFCIRHDGHFEARPAKGAWQDKNSHRVPIRMLALVLSGQARTKESIKERLGYAAWSDPRQRPFATGLSRLRKLLARWSGLPRSEVLPWDGTLLRPHPDLRVVGAVHPAGL